MELLHLHYFMAVGKYRNFTKAAKATYTSQSNISKQIAALEEELGVALFQRTNKMVMFTHAGEKLYNGLESILPKLDSLLEETVAISGEQPLTTICLGLCDTMDLERILPGFIQKIDKTYGEKFVVDLKTYDISDIFEMLAVGNIDCAFVFNIAQSKIPNIKRLAINRGNPCLYYSRRHPLFGKPDLCAADFKKETFLRVTGSDRFDQFEALPFRPQCIVEEKSINAAFQYISTGRAVSVFGPSQNRLGRNDICTIALPTEQKVGTDAIWLEDNEKPEFQEFLRCLQQEIAHK